MNSVLDKLEEVGGYIRGVGFVGGNPLGYDIPFSERTKSGKVLRGIVKELGLNARYVDLWDTPFMEKKFPHVTQAKFNEIYGIAEDGYQIVVLGWKVKKAILESLTWFAIPYYPMEFLPHPAARRRVDLVKLKEGLRILRAIQREGLT